MKRERLFGRGRNRPWKRRDIDCAECDFCGHLEILYSVRGMEMEQGVFIQRYCLRCICYFLAPHFLLEPGEERDRVAADYERRNGCRERDELQRRQWAKTLEFMQRPDGLRSSGDKRIGERYGSAR